MKTVEVNASKKYTVSIENGILNKIGSLIGKDTKYKKALVVTDDIVDELYSKTVISELESIGLETVKFVIKNGEASKNAQNYIMLSNFLAENQLTRSDLVVALGGGVVGDLTGFASATYLRGIDYIQIPTTLLAMVDSSVGGKTAIDIDAGKNLCGAFYQPKAVFCDPETLKTLKPNIFSDGCAEVIKYAIIGSEELFKHLSDNGKDFDREYVITKCVQMKSDIVCEDEFDTGKRQLLNLGHTVGHAVEHLSEFSISHGSAVAIGMAVVSKASDLTDEEKIVELIKKFDLPYKTDFTANELSKVMLSDKKRFGDTINLIIPEKIGNCVIKKIEVKNLENYIDKGLSNEC